MDFNASKIEPLLIVKDISSKYEVDLKEKIFQFVVEAIKYLMTIPHSKEIDVFRYQLSKSVTSIGANFEEAQSTSYKEFIQKMRIALRESNESKYWLRLLKELKIGSQNQVDALFAECEEISKILGAIVSRSQNKLNSLKSNS